ncbi:MAG: DNA methyltransferase [Methanobacteriaceae archaeon]
MSDKKASSQWPYWRPKKHLTSRNPLVAIKRRYNSFLECLDWEDGNLNSTNIKSKIYHCSADSISKFYNTKVDLIITDPPYADHAPYMEYSDLYWSIISGQRTHHLWSKEIVKTNAVGRENDSLDYENRMYKSIKSILSILKDDGYFVFFYLDKNINHWEAIKSALRSSNCVTEDVITIPRQRKSMKTVTSPGKTLDGDLIVVCRKTFDIQHNYKPLLMNELLGQTEGATYFDRFSSFIKNYLTNEVSDSSDWNLKDISRLL